LKARVQAMEGEALLSSLRAVQDGTVMAIHNAENSVGSSSTVRFLLYFSFYFVIVDCYPTSPPLLNNCTK
jgi:hypothetical protein